MFVVSLSWSLGLGLLIVPKPSLAYRLWKERLVDIALSGDHKPFPYLQNSGFEEVGRIGTVKS
jgi:hypothetical protein